MKFYILLFCLTFSLFSQDMTDDQIAIKNTIMTMFDAMRENDATKLKSVFAEKVDSYSIGVNPKTKKAARNAGNIESFIKAVGQPKAEKEWDERIFSWTIHVDADMAVAWTDYSFYHKGKFSHCGVNAFMLFRNEGKWEIYSISDTRRRSNCAEERD